MLYCSSCRPEPFILLTQASCINWYIATLDWIKKSAKYLHPFTTCWQAKVSQCWLCILALSMLYLLNAVVSGNQLFNFHPFVAQKLLVSLIGRSIACCMHAQRGVTVVGLSVCVDAYSGTTGYPKPEINSFRTTNAWKLNKRFSWNDCIREICRECKRKSQYA